MSNKIFRRGSVLMNIISARPETARKDVFNSFLVENATYDGEYEIPCVKTSDDLPEKVITFSDCIRSKDFDSWIVFYEHDSAFERLWHNPQRYLQILKRFKGVISPDFSLYYDMPLCMQIWNIYRGKALAHWLQENGIKIIPNVRWGDERTFEAACLGVEKEKTIAVGTHGCIKTTHGKKMFIEGFDYAVKMLKPKNVIVYGRVPDRIFCLARMQRINILPFESRFGLSRNKEAN